MISKKLIVLLVFWAFADISALSQVYDDFEDGDLTVSPEWHGDIGNFITEAGKLRSYGPQENSLIYVSTTTNMNGDQEWQLYIKLDFAPSASNRHRFYLLSDSSRLVNSKKALFIEIGQTGADRFKLIHQTIGGVQSILESNKLYEGPVEEFIKIIKSGDQWELSFRDTFGEFIPDTTATFDLPEIAGKLYTGMACYYTATRRDKFFFDDFYCGPVQIDTNAPELTSFDILSENEASLNFSENIEVSTASHFMLNEGIEPESINTEPKKVIFTFPVEFREGKNTLEISGVADLVGNQFRDTVLNFDYYQISIPSVGDILINEIMADPSPPVDLPEVEYLELWNRSERHFDLSEFQINGKSISPDKLLLKSLSFIILCRANDTDQLIDYGQVAGMDTWDILSNNGDEVILSFQEAIVIDQVQYSIDWYKSTSKSNGGHSLERRYEDFPCSAKANWAASEDERGGTPGQVNSINPNEDFTGPKVKSANVTDSVTIKIVFDEAVSQTSVQADKFILDGFGELNLTVQDEEVLITTSEKIKANEPFDLTISGVRDCLGNEMKTSSFRAVLPTGAGVGDIVINEILFDPYPSGVDFLELYNHSEKYIDLQDFSLARDSINIISLIDYQFILGPNEFLAVSIDSNRVINDYPHAGKLLQARSIPPMSNDGGEIFLFYEDSLYDYLHYTPDFHLKFLTNTEGVSLERVSPEGPTNDENNWHSASSLIGFATPGKKNSQSRESLMLEAPITLSSPYLTPDQDGEKDFVTIDFQLSRQGCSGNFSIVDPFGKKIKTLSNNAILSHEGHFQWDGTTNDGDIVHTGHYILLAEIFCLSGETFIFNEKVAVVR